ncbi:endo alpha-1,4 polygalactosaminidase [Nitrosomonas communis]|uniref:endo alpha-1,4 polygalactosaminidase n=1 Tax=Nitrosomonas communis TaxID=44574 RepID=UPI0015A5C9E7|nr:endo alpha-1,4 polygalactosaminidase [Nitrosomonas communis]
MNFKILLAKKIKTSLQLLFVSTLLIVNIYFAEFIFPSRSINTGSTSSPQLTVLAVQDEQGSDNNLNTYIKFKASDKQYLSIFKFNASSIANPTILKSEFHANSRGPEKFVESRKFQLFNNSEKWLSIADNLNIQNELRSSDINSSIKDAGQFINNDHSNALRYKTKSSVDKNQPGYFAFVINSSRSNSTMDTSGLTGGTTVMPRTTTGSRRGRWQPVPGLKWQIQYTGTLDTSLKVDVYNIDLFDTSTAVISELQSKGKHIICYFSAGSYESWRPDASAFPASVLGRKLDSWAGEKWLDIRQLNILIPIMQARMKLAADKGCNAVDPDNVDGYSNHTGFPLSYNDQLVYNIAIANAAHNLGLAVSLKNDVDQIKDLVNYFDFAVNEKCFQYNECNTLIPFISASKAVFGIEYNLSDSSFCSQANAMNFDFLKKKLSLDAWREPCR